MKTLKVLFLDELPDMYDAEQRIVRALPKMAKAATSPAYSMKTQQTRPCNLGKRSQGKSTTNN